MCFRYLLHLLRFQVINDFYFETNLLTITLKATVIWIELQLITIKYRIIANSIALSDK